MSDAKPYTMKEAADLDDFDGGPEFRGTVLADETRLIATVAKMEKESDYAQNAVDKICHYRNLAIVLGAKPEHMLGEFDRKLCVDGIDKNDSGNGYFMSVQDCLDDVADTWGAYDKLHAENEALKKRIAELESSKEQSHV